MATFQVDDRLGAGRLVHALTNSRMHTSSVIPGLLSGRAKRRSPSFDLTMASSIFDSATTWCLLERMMKHKPEHKPEQKLEKKRRREALATTLLGAA